MSSLTPKPIHQRLNVNRYELDEGRPHLEVNQEYAKATGLGKVLERVCPAHVYKENPDGSVSTEFAACMECGTCLQVADPQLLRWYLPTYGHGIQFRQG